MTPDFTAIMERDYTNISSDWLSCLYVCCSVLGACLFDHVLHICRVSPNRMKSEGGFLTFLTMIYPLSLRSTVLEAGSEICIIIHLCIVLFAKLGYGCKLSIMLPYVLRLQCHEKFGRQGMQPECSKL